MVEQVIILNTVPVVQGRIKKLEEHLREMETPSIRELWPKYEFSSKDYADAMLHFLRARDIPFDILPVIIGNNAQGAISIDTALIATADKPKLDVTERIYRLASKVLQKVREVESPTPYIKQVLRMLDPFFDEDVMKYRDRISNIFSKDENRNFIHAIFVDGLEMLAKQYGILQLTERKPAYKRGYEEAFRRFLDIAATFTDLYGKETLSERKKAELIYEFKKRISYNGEFPTPRFDMAYLNSLAQMKNGDGVRRLRLDFGVLAGIYYFKDSANIEFWFSRGGKLEKYNAALNDEIDSKVGPFIIRELVELARNNHRKAYSSTYHLKLHPDIEPLRMHPRLLDRIDDTSKALERYFAKRGK